MTLISDAPVRAFLRQILLCAMLASTARSATPLENVGVALLAPDNSVTIGGLNSMENNTPVTSRLDASGRRQVFWAYITPATGTPASGETTTAELVVRHVSDAGAIAEYKLRNPNNTALTYRITNDAYHVAPSIGIDQAGYIHVAANMHYHGWQYWKSAQPYSVTGGFNWKGCALTATPEPNAVGAPSATSPPGYMISYPNFFNDRNGRLYVTYRQRLTSSWGAGCNGGALAQYVVASGTWVAMGGTAYTLPNGLQPWNGTKVPTLIHHTDGSTDIPAYQAYNINMAFDATGDAHLATTLWAAAGGVQANGPTHVVYLKATPGTVEANGYQNWTFLRPDATAISNADLPAQLGTNELWTVYTRPPANQLQFTAKCGVGYRPGSPATPAAIVRYSEMTPPDSWWAGVSRQVYPVNGIDAWNTINHISPQAGYVFGQANAGGGFVTTFTAYSNGTTVYRTNDNGVTGRSYWLDAGSSGLKIDFTHALAHLADTNGQTLLVQHSEPGLDAMNPVSATIATLQVLNFVVPTPGTIPYDFHSLTTGPLVSQDGWYNPRSYWANPTITAGTGPAGVSNMIRETGTGSGGYSAARALPTGTYFTGRETAAVLQFDAQATRFYSGNQVWLGGNGSQQALSDDWAGARAKLGPALGFYNSTAGVYTFRLGAKAANGDWAPNDHVSTVPLGHWITLKLVMDFTANGGAGAGSVFYKDLSVGDAGFTPAGSLQNINLGLTVGAGLAVGCTPDKWNQLGFDLAPVDTYPASLDNLSVTSAIRPTDFPVWAANRGLDPMTSGAPTADPDKDGIPNAVEFVTGGNPLDASTTNLPVAHPVGTNLVFEYTRANDTAYLNPVVQVSSTLAQGSWTDVVSGISVADNADGPGLAHVMVTIPQTTGATLFARLKVIVP